MNNPIEEIEKKQHERWKEADEAFQERMRQDEQRRQNQEIQTIERVGISGLSRDGFVVRWLFDASRRGQIDVEEVHICDLGYAENILMWREIHSLFEHLKKDGCIKSFERKGNEWIKIEGLNKRRLKKKMKSYHPSQEEPGSTRRRVFEWISTLGVIFGIIGVIGTLYFSARQWKDNIVIESLESRVEVLETQPASFTEKIEIQEVTDEVDDEI